MQVPIGERETIGKPPAPFTLADLNHGGVLDLLDLIIAAENWLK